MAFADQLGFSFKAPERRVWIVRDLVSAVRTHLEREYSDIWVEGEISNFRAHDSGHLYFTLKDEGAQIRAVMFRSQARLLRFRPRDGMQVILRGRVTIYEGRGELQLSAEYLEPKGAGALQIAFEQLKAKLEAEGLFDAARKKPIPALPKRIGIVTSPQAAASAGEPARAPAPRSTRSRSATRPRTAGSSRRSRSSSSPTSSARTAVG